MNDISAVIAARSSADLSRSDIIGRQTEITSLIALLQSGTRPVISIVGIGGLGKSTLAQAIVDGVREAFPGGIVTLPMSADPTPDDLIRALGDALGTAPNDLDAAIAEHARRGRTLLFIDALDGSGFAPALEALLLRWPGLHLLITGRMSVRMASEHVILPTPLEIEPTNDATSTLSPAVELFIIRAAEFAPRTMQSSISIATVTDICRSLDGIPLAIELAARWSRLLTFEEIRDNIAHRLDRLVDPGRGTDPRQSTMQGVIAWSYEQLSETDQAILRRLTVFRGGFTLDRVRRMIAGHIAGAPYPYADGWGVKFGHEDYIGHEALLEETAGPNLRGIELAPLDRDAVEVIANLVDLGLIRILRAEYGETRYDLFDTVREFCESLMSDEERRSVHHQHAVIMTALWEAGAEGFYYSNRAVMPKGRLNASLPNFRVAMSWLLAQGLPGAELAQRLSGCAWIFWHQTGRAGEGREWMEAAFALDPTAFSSAAWLPALGFICWIQGDDEAAERILNQSIQVTSNHNLRVSEASAWLYKALVAWRKGPIAQNDMLLYLARARELYQGVGQNLGPGTVAQLYGVIAQMNGDIPSAIDCHTEALHLHRETGYEWGQGAAHLFIGGLQLNSATPDPEKLGESFRHLRDAYELFSAMGDYWGMGAATGVVGAVALKSGQIEIGGKLLGSAQESIRLGHSFLPPYIEGIVAEAVAGLQAATGPQVTLALLEQGSSLEGEERDAFVLTVLNQMIAQTTRTRGVRPPTRLQMPLIRALEEGLDPGQAAIRLGRDDSSIYEMLSRIQERLGVDRWQDIVPTARTHGHLS